MIDEPAPTSEFFPTITPGITRPSIMHSPKAPALKLTKPSCITVVPGKSCLPPCFNGTPYTI